MIFIFFYNFFCLGCITRQCGFKKATQTPNAGYPIKS
jgi:hypothetical protein